MAGNRTLKLSILADVDDLNKKLKSGDDAVGASAEKMGKFGKVAAAAFVAVGAAAVAAAVDFTKAAIEDEKSASRLEQTLKSLTSATDAQVAAVEKSILNISLASGVADDQLRPAYERLLRSTDDITKSQELLNLALDLSAATGKPLATVSDALGKAYDGNTAALGKLGVGLDKTTLKSQTFDQTVADLQKRFGDFSENQANTFQGKLDRMNVAFNEVKETLGGFILDALQPLIDLIVNKMIPKFGEVSDQLDSTFKPVLEKLGEIFKDVIIPLTEKWVNFLFKELWPTIGDLLIPVFNALWEGLQKISKVFTDNKEKLQPLLDLFADLWDFMKKYIIPLFSTILVKAIEDAVDRIVFVVKIIMPVVEAVVKGVRILINGIIDGINLVIGAYNAINGLWGGKDAGKIQRLGETTSTSTGAVGNFAMSTGSVIPSTSNLGLTTGTSASTGGTTTTTSGVTSASNAAAAASVAIGSFNAGSFRLAESASMAPVYNINVTGALDKEGVARQIVEIINESAARGTGGSSAFQVA